MEAPLDEELPVAGADVAVLPAALPVVPAVVALELECELLPHALTRASSAAPPAQTVAARRRVLVR